jgi:hypothetical protein
VLAKIKNFADDVAGRRSRGSLRRPRSVSQAGIAILDMAPLPFVERFSREAEPTADSRDILLVQCLP